MLNTTSGQLARYAAIANNLTNPQLKEAFEQEKIGVSVAYDSSRLSDEGQSEIADKLHTEGVVTIRDVEEVKERETVKQERTTQPTTETPSIAQPPPEESETAKYPRENAAAQEQDADFPYATQSPEAYAIMAVYGELKALRESYQGAAQRAIAVADNTQGAENFTAAAEYVKTLMEIVAQEMADIEAEEGTT
jgi:ParB family chromosome partitioning protein